MIMALWLCMLASSIDFGTISATSNKASVAVTELLVLDGGRCVLSGRNVRAGVPRDGLDPAYFAHPNHQRSPTSACGGCTFVVSAVP